MDRLFGIVTATGWFLLLSALWLGAVGLCGILLLEQQFAFNPSLPASWQLLASGFRSGQAIPLSFILQCLFLLLLLLLGETALLWRLPAIVARLPSLALPHLSLRLPGLPKLRPRTRAEKPTTPAPAPAPPPAAPPPPKAEEKPQSNDSAILARILALFEVWDEPPPSWMAEALRDEIHLLSPDAWPTLESLGRHGLDLLVTLQEHGMLPESPVALQAIGQVETVLRTGLAAEASLPDAAAAPIPLLTLPASWLCEALENFLSAQQDERLPEEQLIMAQTMLEQAMRGMNEADWASLDLFPEKASRVRVLTDRLREDMRKPSPAKPPVEEGAMAPPAVAALNPIEAILALLQRFGFSVEDGAPDAPLLAQRADLLLLLQTIDLNRKSWRLPQGLLGPWSNAETEIWPGRGLWQLLARRRLRHTDARPLAGLLILHGGKIEEEAALAQLVAADRRRSAIGLAWLDEKAAALPDLERELQHLAERAARERHSRHADGHASAQPG